MGTSRRRFGPIIQQGVTVFLVGAAASSLVVSTALAGDGTPEPIGRAATEPAPPNGWTDGSLQTPPTVDSPQMHMLLGSGVAPALAASDGPAALVHAVARSDEATVRPVLESGTYPESAVRSPLEDAVRRGTKEMVGLLVQRGAYPGTLSREGQPMVPLAVALGRADVTAALLDAGADVDTPVLSPVSEEFLELVPGRYARFYLTRDEGLTPLMIAVLRGDLELTRMLLSRGASLGPTRGQFKYPLGMAADRHDIPMMQVLLGRDPEEAARTRRIVISIRSQQAILYENDEPTLKTRVSTGRKGYPTPHGEYVITDKRRRWRSTLYEADMPYFMRLSGGDFGLHEGVVPRGPASHGCIRVPAAAARSLYQRMRLGDPVTIAP